MHPVQNDRRQRGTNCRCVRCLEGAGVPTTGWQDQRQEKTGTFDPRRLPNGGEGLRRRVWQCGTSRKEGPREHRQRWLGRNPSTFGREMKRPAVPRPTNNAAAVFRITGKSERRVRECNICTTRCHRQSRGALVGHLMSNLQADCYSSDACLHEQKAPVASPLLPGASTFGRPRWTDRDVLECVFWVLKTGAQRRACPRNSGANRPVGDACAPGRMTASGTRCGSTSSANSPPPPCSTGREASGTRASRRQKTGALRRKTPKGASEQGG